MQKLWDLASWNMMPLPNPFWIHDVRGHSLGPQSTWCLIFTQLGMSSFVINNNNNSFLIFSGYDPGFNICFCYSFQLLWGITPKGTWFWSDRSMIWTQILLKVYVHFTMRSFFSFLRWNSHFFQLKPHLFSDMASLIVLNTVTPPPLESLLSLGTTVACLQRWPSSNSCFLMIRP